LSFTLDFDYSGNVPKHILGDYNVALFNKKDPVALDVGCAIGAFPMKWHNCFDKVYCIDACYHNLKILDKNLNKNQINNCYSFHFAASSKTGQLRKIYNNKNAAYNNILEDHDVIYKSGTNPQGTKQIKEVNVSNKQFHYAYTISFEDLITFLNLDRIDFLKVDIEGAEYNFLYESDLSIVDVLAVEVHFLQNEQSKKLMKKINDEFVLLTKKERIHGEYLFINKKKIGQTINRNLDSNKFDDLSMCWK